MKSSSRRNFLKQSAAGACAAYVHKSLSPLGNSGGLIAWAGPSAVQGPLGSDPLLILINLDGGCSYNITPLYSGAYRDRNRRISYGPENSIPLTADQGLHPTLTGLKPVWDEGNLAIFNLLGINDPSGMTLSHADGANVRLTALSDIKDVRSGVTPGWVVRLTSSYGELFSGIAINSGRASITSSGTNPPLSIISLDELGEQVLIREEVGEWMRLTRRVVLDSDSADISANNTLVRNGMRNLDSAFDRLSVESQVTLPVIANPFNLSNDGSGFIRGCRDAAKLLIARSLKVRFLYLELGGFDTHGEEKNMLTDLLNTVNRGLTPLIQSIKAAGRWNDTVIATLSEFGRTHENGAGGSDHGASASMFVMGGRVKGGQKSPVPTDAQIRGNGTFLRDVSVDFRHVYQEIVAAMGMSPESIFPSPIPRRNLDLF